MLPVKVAILSVKRGGDTILGSVETSIRNLENLAASADDNGDILQNPSSRGLQVLGLRGDKEIAKLRVKFAELIGPTASSSFMDDSSHGDRSRAGSLSQASTRLSGAMLPVNRNGRDSTDQDIVLEFASKIDLSSSQLTQSRRGSSDSTMDGDEVLVDPYAVDMATLPNRFSSTTPRMPTFQDYVVDGCELDLCVAIDFTSSNGKTARLTSICNHRRAHFHVSLGCIVQVTPVTQGLFITRAKWSSMITRKRSHRSVMLFHPTVRPKSLWFGGLAQSLMVLFDIYSSVELPNPLKVWTESLKRTKVFLRATSP